MNYRRETITQKIFKEKFQCMILSSINIRMK